MEEDIFKINYVPYVKGKKYRTSSFLKKIKKHKFAVMLISILLLTCIANMLLVYNFIKLLETLQ